MNKRIQELLKQSTKEVDPYDRVWVFSKVDQAKFAELIVRECAIICKESGDVPAVLVSEDILLHFGVEE